jgi:outer membrane protein assembly factor BamB
VTFLERPTYSRVITESTECEAFGSVVRLPLLPHSFIEDLWLALRPELRDALASDGLWLGTVNVADAVQLYLGITGDIAPLILDVGIPCLGNFLAAGLDILSFKLTDRLATAEGVEEVVGASRALLDEVGLEMTGCFCEAGLPVICEVVSKAVEIFRLGVRAIDDGVFRPFDILRTPIYARTTLGPSNLTVTLAAEPAAGHAPLEGVDLRAETHGEASGTINFTFYCDRADAGIDVTPGWAAKFDQVSQTSLTAVDACAYASPGLYTAKVIVERGTSAAEARTEMAVTGGGERIEHVSGGGQTGVPGSALPQPIVVQALDENGLPLPNVEVTFLVTEGGGSVEPGTALTDASGLAQTSWTLGPAPGLNALQASAPSLGSSLTLSATGVPDDGWEFAPQSSGERFHSSPAIASDGIIFIPTTNTSVLDHGRLYAIRPDGQPLWTDPFPVGGDQTPAISEEDELVHVGEDEKLYVIDRASGTELCRVPLDGFSATSPALNGDTAYIATGQLGGTVFAVKISRPCGVLWEFERPAIGLGFQSPPAVADDGSIYAASWETDSTYSLNPDGSLRWGFQAQEFFLSSPAIAGDILYIGGGTTFYALDRITGQPRWTRVLGGDVNSSPALGSDGKVFVGADDGRLYGFTSSGEPVWPPGNSWDPPNRSSAAVGSDGNIYFAPTDAEIVGVSPLNGEVVWSYPTGGGAGSSNSSSPSLAGGRVYIGRGNIFFAIPAPASGLATSSWPKFRHDLRNTGRAGAPLAGIRVSRD